DQAASPKPRCCRLRHAKPHWMRGTRGRGIEVREMLDPSCDGQVGKSKTALGLVNCKVPNLFLAMTKLARCRRCCASNLFAARRTELLAAAAQFSAARFAV